MRGSYFAEERRRRKKGKKTGEDHAGGTEGFSRKGYSPAALEEVAREAAIAKGTLYLYFRDKADLFSSTIIYVLDSLTEKMQERVTDTMAPFEIMKTIAYAELDFFAKNSEFFGLVHTVMSGNLLGNHESLLKTITARRGELIKYLNGLIGEARRDGRIRDDIDTEEVTYAFIGMVESAIDQMHFREGPCDRKGGTSGVTGADLDRKVDTIMHILLDGVRPDRQRN